VVLLLGPSSWPSNRSSSSPTNDVRRLRTTRLCTTFVQSCIFVFVFVLRGLLAILLLSNFPESLLNPGMELSIHFTGQHLDVTTSMMAMFGHGWRHVESTKQGEFLFPCSIHHYFATMDPLLLTTGSMYPHGFWKYRPRGTISTGLRHCR
jgi:hypothetical protein